MRCSSAASSGSRVLTLSICRLGTRSRCTRLAGERSWKTTSSSSCAVTRKRTRSFRTGAQRGIRQKRGNCLLAPHAPPENQASLSSPRRRHNLVALPPRSRLPVRYSRFPPR
ncbi:hypothetical protein BJY59DRAFT_704668 [Rhodotorula toruloides]